MGKTFIHRGEAHLKLPYPDFMDGKLFCTLRWSSMLQAV